MDFISLLLRHGQHLVLSEQVFRIFRLTDLLRLDSILDVYKVLDLFIQKLRRVHRVFLGLVV